MDRSRSDKSVGRFSNKSIEDRLINRQKMLKARLDAFKARAIHKKLMSNQQVPKINSKSKRLASKSQTKISNTTNKLDRAHEILKNSRFIPKKLKLSLASLESPAFADKKSFIKPIRYDKVLSTDRSESPVTFPSLCNTSRSVISELHSDISQRNELLFNLKHQDYKKSGIHQKEPSLTTLSFQERSQKWLSRKQERINKLRIDKESTATNGCTFRPELSSKRSCGSTQRSLSARSSYSITGRFIRKSLMKGDLDDPKNTSRETSKTSRNHISQSSASSLYSCIGPVSVSISYSSGFSTSLSKRFRPLINYKNLTVRS